MIKPVDYTGLGRSFDGESTPLKGIESALFRLSDDIAKEFREYLISNGIESTQALAYSIGGVPVTISDNGAEMKIEALDYFKFIDRGVDGVINKHGSPFSFKTIKPPSINGIESIRTFVGAKGIPAIPDIDGITYAIAVSIKKKGIKPKNIFDGVIEGGLLDRMAESIANALGFSVALTIEDKFKGWQ